MKPRCPTPGGNLSTTTTTPSDSTTSSTTVTTTSSEQPVLTGTQATGTNVAGQSGGTGPLATTGASPILGPLTAIGGLLLTFGGLLFLATRRHGRDGGLA